jgi:acetolactate synthase-1/2/3 large subunit
MIAQGTGAHAVVGALKRHGVNTIFGQSLPSMLHLVAEREGIRQIAYRTENAGGYMADAYARVTGKIGVVTAQNGPAAALLVPPLAEALKASIPILALVQDVSAEHTDRNAFQDLDHIGMFTAVTKWVRRVSDVSRLEDYIDQAMTAACTGRPGPVVLMLPADILLQPYGSAKRSHSLGYYPLDRVTSAKERIEEAAVLLLNAKNPIVIAGGGVHLSAAHRELSALQEHCHLVVATTLMGKGSVDETHPLSVGVMTYFLGPNGSARHQRSLLENADVVLLIGTRTNQNGTDSWKLYPKNAIFIHLDIDGNEVGRNYESKRLVGDAKLTLAALTEAMQAGNLAKRKNSRQALEKKIAEGRAAYLKESESVRNAKSMPVRPERIMQEIQLNLTEESIVVADASYSSIWIANYLVALKAGMRFITPRGLAGLGWGFPMALGVKVAKPEKEVFCVVGDGGFGHVWSELETAARMGIKVTLILINNGILGYQKHAENVKFGDHTSAVHFNPVDHAAIARDSGCDGIRVTDPNELGSALAQAKKNTGTTLIEVICDENAFPPITFYTPDAVEIK